MNCPKCGFQQDEGTECMRCGLIFARYHAVVAAPQSRPKPRESVGQLIGSPLRKFYRVFRWVSLVGLIIVISLILKTSPPPRIEVTADAVQHAEAKIQELQSSISQETEHTLEMDEPELNGWLRENLALKKPQDTAPTPTYQMQKSPASLAKKATAGSKTLEDLSLEEAQSSVRDVQIELLEDSLRLYALVDVHGADISMELEGKVQVVDGYIRLEPTSGKLGSLPLMAQMLQSVAHRLFDSPENKEKFRLPPNIQDIRVEHSQFIVESR